MALLIYLTVLLLLFFFDKNDMKLYLTSCAISILILINVPILLTVYVDLIVTNLELLEMCLNDFLVSSATDGKMNSNKPQITVQQTENFVDQLVSMKSIYLSIWEISDLFNASMGKQIFIFISFIMLSLVFGGFRIFQSVIGEKNSEDIEGTIIFDLIIIINMISLVDSCQRPSGFVSILNKVSASNLIRFFPDKENFHSAF